MQLLARHKDLVKSTFVFNYSNKAPYAQGHHALRMLKILLWHSLAGKNYTVAKLSQQT